MNNKQLADFLFPGISKTPADYEEIYPPRSLPENAFVTRLGPSPTGFIHLGNLYVALACERLAHQSNGLFYLRIEDTDEKREVEGAVESLINSLGYFNINFDDDTSYAPYRQSERGEIYKCYIKHLVSIGLAYPCFCTEEELSKKRKIQEKKDITPGYHGEFAVCRNLSFDEIRKNIEEKKPYVVRLKSKAGNGTFTIKDGIRGELTMPENFQDIVILKQTGLPTYHLAHVVDDHLMRTTHVLRGEEWLSSLPIHYELFNALSFELPTYCHTAVLMKTENGVKRKLSKRKDPELSLEYYQSQGYHKKAVMEYLMTILNSNYEEWRIANPLTDFSEFSFTLEKMSSSGILFDIDKLNYISQETLVTISDEEIAGFLLDYVKKWKPEKYDMLSSDIEKLTRIIGMDRHGQNPRKDLIYGEQILKHIAYFYNDEQIDDCPEMFKNSEGRTLLKAYLNTYSYSDDKTLWFEKIRNIAESNGYAPKPRDYKKNPEQYKGHVGDVSTLIRVALIGRLTSPDLWEIQQILGKDDTVRRISNFLNTLPDSL